MEKLVNNLKHIAVTLGIKKSNNVYVISYPKSGRTWLRVLVSKAMCEHYNLGTGLILDPKLLSRKANCFRTVFSHDVSGFGNRVSWKNLVPDRSHYATHRIILLTRQPEDVIVSSYFHLTQRQKMFAGSISELIRDERWGIYKILSFYNVWFANRNTPYKFLLISYEEMQRNTDKVLKSVLEFMGNKPIPDNIIKQAVEFSRFNNLKKMETENSALLINYFSRRKTDRKDTKNPQSYKVREGKVNGYLKYLSSEDIEYIEQAKAELGSPFYS